MSRQWTRLPAFHRGSTSRDDRGGGNTADTAGGSHNASRGRGGSGRGGASRKAVFQPSVRALPLGSSPQTLAEQLPRDRKNKIGHQSLLLVNKRASATTADAGQKAEVANGAADAAVAEVEPTVINPWAARLKERAIAVDSTDSQDLPPQKDTLVAPVEVMPIPELGGVAEDVDRWDEMVDSGIEFLKSGPHTQSQMDTIINGRFAEEPKSESSASVALVPEMRISSDETAAIIGTKTENNNRTELGSDVQEHTEESLNPQPKSVPELAVTTSSKAAAAAEKWGKPTKTSTTDTQPTQAQASRWWKASLSGGARTTPTPTPPPQLPDKKSQRQGSLKLGAMQKSDSDAAAKGRTTKPDTGMADGKVKRGVARRQTASVPTVVPPMVLSKAMVRSREYSPSLRPEPASEPQSVPDSSIEEQAAVEAVVEAVVVDVKPEVTASTNSKTEEKATTPLSSKPATPLEKKLTNTGGSDIQQTNSWRTGPRPKPQSQPHSQSPLSQSPADSAAGARRRNTIAPRGSMRPSSTPQDRADRSRKALSTASWRAAPKTEESSDRAKTTFENAFAGATATQANPMLSKNDPVANSTQMPRIDRQRAQTQSASISSAQASHGLYYSQVSSGGLQSSGENEQSKLNDLLQGQSSSHMTKGAAPAVAAGSGSMDQPLLSQKILADILGEDGISTHRSDSISKNVDLGSALSHPKPVKPIGASSKGLPTAPSKVSIASATATAAAPSGTNDGYSGRNPSSALEQSSLGLSSASLFQLNENTLLVSPYSVASTHSAMGSSSASISVAAAAASASDSRPFSWQHAHSGHRNDDPRYRHGYFHPASSSSAPGLHDVSTYNHHQQQHGSTAPAYNTAPSMVAEQQWMYAPAMPAQPAVYPLYNGNLEGIGSGSASGPLLGAFESGATMLWADPGQHTLGSSGNRPIRGHSDNSHTPSHVEVNGGSGQQRGYKSANRTPRPIGTRNTPTGGSRNVRSRQGNGNSQSSAHDHIQKQQQQQQQHQHWFPQYAGIQPQIYMHSPAPGYAASSPHNSPHMAAVHAAGGSAGISSYMVPFSHMAETGNPHHHPMLAMQQAPLAPLSSSSQNHPHVHSQLHGGNSAENVKSPAYMGTLQPQYFSNHAHASPPQQYAYAYAGPPTGSQHHHSQHHQHHHNQQAYSPYTTVPSYGVDPVHGGYAPMYMGHVDVSQGVPGGQYYHTSTDPQLSEQQQQQQHYQQSPLSLSAVPFQPSMSVKQENLDQQPPGQHSQRPRSKGLELIQRSASNSDVNTVTSTPKKDFQSDNAAVPTISAAGTVSSKALQADPKPKSRSGTPQSNLAKESQGRGRRSQDRRSQDRRSQDRRNPKQQPANVTASANATLSSAKQVAADTETAQSPPKSDSKRRPKSDRAKKASKPASTELAQEPAEQQQQTGKRGRGGHARSGRGAKRTDKAVLKA